MADDVDRVEVERGAERQHIGGMERDIVAVRWLGAEAAPTQIQRDGVPSLGGERWPHLRELHLAGRQPVDERHRALRRGRLAPGLVVQRDIGQAQIMRAIYESWQAQTRRWRPSAMIASQRVAWSMLRFSIVTRYNLILNGANCCGVASAGA